MLAAERVCAAIMSPLQPPVGDRHTLALNRLWKSLIASLAADGLFRSENFTTSLRRFSARQKSSTSRHAADGDGSPVRHRTCFSTDQPNPCRPHHCNLSLKLASTQSTNDITHLHADQLFNGGIGCSIEIPRTVEEKYVALLESEHRNTRYFPTSITTRNPR